MSIVQAAGNREEQLLTNIKGVLEAKNYSREAPLLVRGGIAATHSLKELLITNSVDMEAASDASITALCTIDSEPDEIVEAFQKLISFTEESSSVHKSEIAQAIFPIFVHVYFSLVSTGSEDIACDFYARFSGGVVSPAHKTELSEVSKIVTAKQVDTSPLANKFRQQKFCLRMSNQAFQMLVHFLQLCSTPILLNIIQKYLAIEVYGSTPLMNGDVKNEQKKTPQLVNFTKPRIPQFHSSPELQIKRKKPPKSDSVARQQESNHTPFGSFAGSSGFIMAAGIDDLIGKGKPLQRTASGSTCTSQPSHLAEFRDKLAMTSQFDPSPPSLALYTVHCGQQQGVHCAAINSTSRLYACGFSDSSIHLWSQLPPETDHMNLNLNPPINSQHFKSLKDHLLLLGHHGAVHGTCFNGDGRFLLSASEDCSVQLWNTHSHSALVSYRGHAYPVWDVSFSPVDVYFASVSLDRTARLWTTDLVYPLRLFTGHTASVDVVRFHPNGKYIATGSSDETCRLWDIQNGKCVRLMTGSKCAVSCMAFAPNGKQLVSGGVNGNIVIWDIGSGAILKEIQAAPQGGSVTSVNFSADGTLLASSWHDNQIRVWNTRNIGMLSPTTTTSSVPVDLVSHHSTINRVLLQLQFSHRNCLVAIAASNTPSSNTANSVTQSIGAPMTS